MIFYNPFFSGFPPFPFEKSTRRSPKVDNTLKKSNFNSQRQNNELPSNVDFSTKNSNYITADKIFSETSDSQSDNKKSNHKSSSFGLGKFNDYLQETDSLILLALLYFLYTQKSSSGPLMICLLLLLLDDD